MMFILLIGVVLFNKFFYKSYLNPIFLQSVIWLIYYFFLFINIKYYDVHIEAIQNFVVYQLIGFSLGGLFCCLFTKKNSVYKRILPEEHANELTLKNIIYIYPFVLVVLIISLFLIIKESGTISIFNIGNLRENLVEDDGKKYGSLGVIQLLISVYVIIFIGIKDAIKKNFFKFITILIPFLYFTLMLGSKGQFVFFFSAVLYLLSWSKRLNKSYLLFSGLLLVAILLGLTFLRLESDNTSYSFSKDSLAELLLVYTVTSLPALSLIKFSSPKIFGYYTFRVIYVWLNKFGFAFPIAPVLSEYTLTPLPTNVYSYIKPYYHDFGLTGVFWLPFILGFLHNYFYFAANKGKLNYIIFASLLVYPLGMQIFEENYFRQLSIWIYIFILILILTKVKIYDIWCSNSNIQSAT